MRNKKAVIEAGIPIEQLKLIAIKREVKTDTGLTWEWKYGEEGKLCKIEDACIEAMRDKGWYGVHDEGNALRLLIKCAALPDIAKLSIHNHYSNVIGIFYYNAEHPTLPTHEFTGAELLENIKNATTAQISRNIQFLQAFQSCNDCTMPFFEFPHPSSEKFLIEMLKQVGINRLYEIAKLVYLVKKMPTTSREDSQYMGLSGSEQEQKKWEHPPRRFSFPDLTLVGDHGIKFLEVKSPSDKISPTQINAFTQILFPLGLAGAVLEVLKA